MKILAMREVAVDRQSVLAAIDAPLPYCLIGHNFDTLPDPELSLVRADMYSARTVVHPSVDLVRLPRGSRLFGGRHALLESDGVLLAEQVPPHEILDEQDILNLAAEDHETVYVDEPCLLVWRFGIMVWGHWLGELLPRVLLAERYFPGRFKYVLPQDIFNFVATRNVWNSVWETMRCLGIGRDRVLISRYDRQYVFSELYGITPIITRHAFHPAALRDMRSTYHPSSGPFDARSPHRRKVAILRTESKARNITNVSEVAGVLSRHEYDFVEVGRLPFLEQVHLFATARTVVGVLASGLSGLVFAPEKVKVLSMAPQSYRNMFFYSMLQDRRAAYFDLRGLITNKDARFLGFSDFYINVDALEEGLQILDQSDLSTE